MLGYTVDDIHNCIISMGFRQFDYEVNTNHVPWCLGVSKGWSSLKSHRHCTFV
jgi:hypothetical protein